MGLSYEMKKKYAETINALFDGSVRATPDQINETLCLYTDKMILDITNCSKNITNFAFNVFYTFTFSHFTKFAVQYALGRWFPSMSLLDDFVKWSAVEKADYEFSGFIADWISELTKRRKFVGCVYTARANWRSRFEIELLGI